MDKKDEKKYIVALEISGTRVNGVLASVPADNTGKQHLPKIEGIVSEDECEGVQYGRVQNLINATRATKAVVHEMSKQPEIEDGEITGCYAGLGGLTMGSEKITAEIELATEMEITHEILRKLFEEAAHRGKVSKRVLQVLPRRFYVDGQVVTEPIGTTGRRIKGDFTLVNCDIKNQRQLERVFNDKMHMQVFRYVETPLAIADMVLDEEEKQIGCMLVDIGAGTTTVSIYKDRCLQYLAVLPMGSKYITRDIQVGLNMTHEKAEAAKIEYGDALWTENASSDEISRIKSYVAARAYEIVANIKANIEYAGYKIADIPAGLILTGRGTRLANFDKLVATKIDLPVRMAKLPETLNFAFSFGTVHPEDYMSVIALALRVARKTDFRDCVSFVQPVQETITIEETAPRHNEPAPATNTEFVPIPVDPENDDDDEGWKNDDAPVEDPRDNLAQTLDSRSDHASNNSGKKPTKPQKPGGVSSLLRKIQSNVVNLINGDNINDGNLDD